MVLGAEAKLAIRGLCVAGDAHCDKLTVVVFVSLDIAMLGCRHLGRDLVQRTADSVCLFSILSIWENVAEEEILDKRFHNNDLR